MKTESNDIDLRRLWREIKKAWWLYLVSFVVLMTLAVIYAKNRMPVYNTYSEMLIEEQKSGQAAMLAAASKSSSAMKMLSLSSASTANEIRILNSYSMLASLVEKTGLNTVYIERDGIKKALLFPDSPIAVEIPQHVLDTLGKGFKVKVELHNGKADITVSTGFMGMEKLAHVENATLPIDIKNSIAPFRLKATGSYRPDLDTRIDVNVIGTPSAVKALSEDLHIDADDKNSDAITFQLDGPSRARAQYVLNTLMETYNRRRLERRHETAANELAYCNDRLEKLMSQLEESEKKVEDFKRANNTVVMALDSAGWIGKALGSKATSPIEQNRLAYYDQVLFTLENDRGSNTFIPSSIDGEQPNQLAQQYNELVAKKRELERSATDENPSLINLNQQLAEMRSTMMVNLRQNLEMSRKNLASISSLRGEALSEMQRAPALERELFDLLRDKTIKNEIYLYLLQRREAAELEISATDTLGYIIDPAWSAVKPNKTKSIVAIVIAFLLSILGPTLLVWLWMRRRDTLRLPMDTAFIGLEENTLLGSEDDIRALRARIMAMKDVDTLYLCDTAGDGETAIMRRLVDTLNAFDTPIAIVTPGDIIPGESGNDIYLTSSFENERQRLLETYRFVAAVVDDHGHLDEMTAAIDADRARLIVFANSGKLRRNALRRLLRGQMSDHILVFILTPTKVRN